MKRMGIDFTFVDPDCTEAELEAAFRPETRAVFGETIANPALTVLDFEKFARAAHAHGVPLIVDNTFATPVNCRPFEWGDVYKRQVPHREEGLLRPIQGLPLGAGHPEGHIISARLAPAPPLRLLCRPGGGAQQGQTEAQRQYSLHGTHSLQHSIPICIIAPLVFPDKLQSNNKW